MPRAGRTPGVVLGFVFVASLAKGSYAEDATGPGSLPLLSYDAPPRCPDRGTFEAKVRARTDARPELALSVRIADETTRFAGRLVVGTASREIAAPNCDEVVDGLALVAALALERQKDESEPGTTPGAGDSSVPVDTAQRGGDATESTGASAPAPEPADLTITVREPTTRAPRRSSLSFVATGLAVSGVAPDVRPAASLGIEWASRAGAASEVSLRAALLAALPETVDTPDGRARFEFVAAMFGACARRRMLAGAASIGACAVFEGGTLWAAGSDTLHPASARRNWLAPGLALETEWGLAGPLSILAGFGGVIPLSRDNFLLGDTTVHEVPWIALRGELGLAVRLW